MPTISTFHGIAIRMFFAPAEHPPPHFHATHAGQSMKVNIETCEIMRGKLPRKQTRLVLAWAELHQDELMACWRLAMTGQELTKIEPLQ